MTKKILSFLLAALCLVPLLATSALAESETSADPLIYGFRCYDDETSNGENYGFVSFSASAPDELDLLSPQSDLANVYCGAYYCGSFYGVDERGVLFSCPLNDFTRTPISTVITDMNSWTPAEMTFDYTTNTMYLMAINKQSAASPRVLYTVDIVTGETTRAADVAGNIQLRTLAADPNGVLYGIDSKGDLYIVDKVTGTCTAVGPTGKECAHLQSMSFDRRSGQLYWAQYYGFGYGRLVRIDAATGETTDLGSIGANAEISGLFFATDAYRITFDSETGGIAKDVGSSFYDPGASVVLKATADAGYAFGGWESPDGGTLTASADAETTFTMPAADVAMHAYFVPTKSYFLRTVRSSDLAIEAEGKKVYYNASLLAAPWSESSDSYALLLKKTGRRAVICAYDVSLAAGGNVDDAFKGKITVTLLVSEQYEGRKLSIYTYRDGAIKSMSARVKDGRISYKTNEVTPVALTQKSGWGTFWTILICLAVVAGGLFAAYKLKLASVPSGSGKPRRSLRDVFAGAGKSLREFLAGKGGRSRSFSLRGGQHAAPPQPPVEQTEMTATSEGLFDVARNAEITGNIEDK